MKRAAFGAAGVLLGLVLLLFATAPLSKSLQPITAPSLTLLSAEGVPIARRGAVVGAPVDAGALPSHVVQPFLAIEDRRFYAHAGIDLRGIARAMVANLKAGGVVEGGSTITQQLAKLSFLSPERTIWRKLQEMVLAFWLEARLGKDEILSRYLSSVYFGDNVFGLRAAAHHYFSREPEELSVEQAAMLAGLLKAPSTLAPTSNLEGARERADRVIEAMIDAGMLSRTEANDLPAVTLGAGGVEKLPSGSYFADWVLSRNGDVLDDKYPALTLTTTLEDRLQREAVEAIRRVGTGGAQVALVAMRPDGRVVAMVGGNSYARSPFNRATQALRQSGSTFKLFVYLAALREGFTPRTLIEDRPVRIGNWAPENYGRRYRGRIPLRQAFAVSSNVAAVRLAEEVGRDKVAAAARELGVTADLEQGPTMSLGTSAISLVEMVGAYAAVAAGRHPVRPHGLRLDDSGPGDTAPMAADVRSHMLELLWAAANEGSGRAARLDTRTYGKTGTSQDSRDAYFIGFAGGLITGVWIGHDDNRPMPGAQGGGAPARIWRTFMASALAPADGAPRERPEPRQRAPRNDGPAPTGAAPDPAIMREYDVELAPVPDVRWQGPIGIEPLGDEPEDPIVDTGEADAAVPILLEDVPSSPIEPAIAAEEAPAPALPAGPAGVPD